MKKVLALVLMLFLAFSFAAADEEPTEARALQRLNDYSYAVGHYYEEPEKIYDFLTESFRGQMTREEFCEAFAKDRTYPYLTPLYFWNPTVIMNEDGLSGSATYLRAARIEGMFYDVTFVYENGDFYIEDWAQFLDGSYLDKFEDVNYSLDWYFDLDDMKK